MSKQDAQDSTAAALLAQLDRDARAREKAVRAMLTPEQRAEFDAGLEESAPGATPCGSCGTRCPSFSDGRLSCWTTEAGA